jgi:hypothetical protein
MPNYKHWLHGCHHGSVCEQARQNARARTSLPGSTPAGRPAEQARLAARSRSATARWIPGGYRVSTYHKSRGGQGEHGHRGGRVGCGSASHAFYSRERDRSAKKRSQPQPRPRPRPRQRGRQLVARGTWRGDTRLLACFARRETRLRWSLLLCYLDGWCCSICSSPGMAAATS